MPFSRGEWPELQASPAQPKITAGRQQAYLRIRRHIFQGGTAQRRRRYVDDARKRAGSAVGIRETRSSRLHESDTGAGAAAGVSAPAGLSVRRRGQSATVHSRSATGRDDRRFSAAGSLPGELRLSRRLARTGGISSGFSIRRRRFRAFPAGRLRIGRRRGRAGGLRLRLRRS